MQWYFPAYPVASQGWIFPFNAFQSLLGIGAAIELTAMLLMEAVFGLPGVVAAPIVYAWVKDELKSAGLV